MIIKRLLFRAIYIVLIYPITYTLETSAATKPSAINDKLFLKIYYNSSLKGDTLTLTMHSTFRAPLDISSQIGIKSTQNEQGFFEFVVPVKTRCGYFTLGKKRTFTELGDHGLMDLMSPQFWEKGDSITIRLNHTETQAGLYWNASFSGRGATKYNLGNSIENDFKNVNAGFRINGIMPRTYTGSMLFSDHLDFLSDRDEILLALLEKNKAKITQLSYDILKCKVIFNPYFPSVLDVSRKYYSDSLKNASNSKKVEYMIRYDAKFGKNIKSNISNHALEYSIDYFKFAFNKLKIDSYFFCGRMSLNWMYNEIKQNAFGNLRESLIISSLVNVKGERNIDSLYNDSKSFIKSPSYLHVLDDLQYSAPGEKIVDFKLQDSAGEIKSMSDFNNKVILLDFWFTGCPGCHLYYKNTLSKVEEVFKDNPNVKFLSISADSSREKWMEGLSSGLYTSDFAVNLFTNGEGFKHPIIKLNNIQAFPTAILIDSSGIIRYFNSVDLYQKESLVKAINELL